jgi:hypothetical protein
MRSLHSIKESIPIIERIWNSWWQANKTQLDLIAIANLEIDPWDVAKCKLINCCMVVNVL